MKIIVLCNFLLNLNPTLLYSDFLCIPCNFFASHAKAPIQFLRNLVVAGARWSPFNIVWQQKYRVNIGVLMQVICETSALYCLYLYRVFVY